MNSIKPEKAGWYRVVIARPHNPDDTETVEQYEDWFYFCGERWDTEATEPYTTVVKIIKPE